MSEPLQHDYTRKTYQSGWAIVDFDFLAAGTVKVKAFGLKRHIRHKTLEEAYLLPGEEIVISMPDGEVLYEIATIQYYRDPYDMYQAELKYMQHLTGMRIVAQRDERQRARRMEWQQKIRTTSPKPSE
jgi:hypothetical protein